MKLFYTNDFTGHWPVGTAAIVWANDESDARDKLDAAIAAEGLTPSANGGYTVREFMPNSRPLILADGDY